MSSPKYTRAGNGQKSDGDEERGPKERPSESSTFHANQPTPPRSNLLTYLTRKEQPYEKFRADVSDLDDLDDDELAEITALGDQSTLSLSSPVPGAPLPANYSHSSSNGKTAASGAEDDDDSEVLWYVDNYEASMSKARTGSCLFGTGGTAAALEQLKIIIRMGAPICVEKFSAFVPNFVLLLFYGRLGPDELAAGGFAFMFGNVTGISLIVGFALGLPPLVAQAYGAENYLRCGELLQRQLLIHVTVVLPLVAMLWLNAEEILLAMGQPPAIVELTATFLRWRLPSMPFLCLSESLGSFLKAQRIMVAPMVVVASINLSSLLLAVVFVLPGHGVFSLGFVGGPLALSIANVVIALVLVAKTPKWLREHGVSSAWPRWSLSSASTGWCEVLSLGLPAALMMWGEWWAFETNLFLAGLLCGNEDSSSVSSGSGGSRNSNSSSYSIISGGGDGRGSSSSDMGAAPSCLQLDVSAVIANTMVLAYFCHNGFSWAASAHVGNLLGAGDPATANLTCRVTLMLVSCISGTMATSLVLGRHQWGAVFTQDPLVVDGVAQLLPIVAGYVFMDALGPSALNSLLRALGVVHGPAVVNIAAFYVVGIPLGVYLTFGAPHWGQSRGQDGLWVGLVVGVFCMVVGLGCSLARVDFVATSMEVRSRALEKDVDNGDGSSRNSSSINSSSSSGGSSSRSGGDGSSGLVSKEGNNHEFNPLRDLEVAIEMADALTAHDSNHRTRQSAEKSTAQEAII